MLVASASTDSLLHQNFWSPPQNCPYNFVAETKPIFPSCMNWKYTFSASLFNFFLLIFPSRFYWIRRLFIVALHTVTITKLPSYPFLPRYHRYICLYLIAIRNSHWVSLCYRIAASTRLPPFALKYFSHLLPNDLTAQGILADCKARDLIFGTEPSFETQCLRMICSSQS